MKSLGWQWDLWDIQEWLRQLNAAPNELDYMAREIELRRAQDGECPFCGCEEPHRCREEM